MLCVGKSAVTPICNTNPVSVAIVLLGSGKPALPRNGGDVVVPWQDDGVARQIGQTRKRGDHVRGVSALEIGAAVRAMEQRIT